MVNLNTTNPSTNTLQILKTKRYSRRTSLYMNVFQYKIIKRKQRGPILYRYTILLFKKNCSWADYVLLIKGK